MKLPSQKEIKQQEEKMKKIYECYRYLYENADEEGLRKKIQELGREHMLSKVTETSFSILQPIEDKLRELKKSNEKEKTS